MNVNEVRKIVKLNGGCVCVHIYIYIYIYIYITF